MTLARMWESVPDILLEEIFSYLSHKERLSAAQVCRHWYDVFLSPSIWRHFVIGENTFASRLSYNQFKKCYNTKVSAYKVQKWVMSVGCFVQSITIPAHTNFFHLFEFLTSFANCLEYYEDQCPMESLEEFHFTFACEIRNAFDGEKEIIGTGGQILQALKRLLGCLPELRALTLNNLLLDVYDTQGLLDPVLKTCSSSLNSLEILNCTKERYPLFHAGMFTNLRRLVISSLQLTDDVVLMVAGRPTMEDLLIVENQYSLRGDPIQPETWEEVKIRGPNLRVRLEQRGRVPRALTVQENAPVSAIIFNSPLACMSGETVNQIVRHYSDYLEVYAQLGLPRKFPSKSFRDRCDLHTMFMIQQCHKLRTLAINERISTATLLRIAENTKNLKHLYVRKNAVLLKRDWPRNTIWSQEYYDYWKDVVQSHEGTSLAMKSQFGHSWKMLSDAQFKRLVL